MGGLGETGLMGYRSPISDLGFTPPALTQRHSLDQVIKFGHSAIHAEGECLSLCIDFFLLVRTATEID